MENQAAYLFAANTRLEVKPSPLKMPRRGEVLIRNFAITISPLDVLRQDGGIALDRYPHIPGIEVAGEVMAVGEGVGRFRTGDRVAGLAVQIWTGDDANAGFQLFTIAPACVTARIPDDVEFTTVSALPLALSTAAGGLYERCYLGLTPPKEARFRRKKSGEQVLLVWGGCSSITSCAIQLAVASGLKVLVTAPEKYHGCIRGLGADYVIDQSQKNAVQRLIEAATGKIIIGAFDVVSTKSSSMRCAEFLHHFGGGICFATNPVDFGDHCVLLGDVQRVSGRPPSHSCEGGYPIWMGVWCDFMEQGLRAGTLWVRPDSLVLQGGLDKCQEALDIHRKDPSGPDIVVELGV